MARKPAHFTNHTAEEVHLGFKAAVQSLGMPVSDRESQLQEIRLDGVRIGDRKGELRKPGTSYYGQTFVEARSAAGLMVDLGLASIVLDVRRREPPMPDIEVCLRDGGSIFIEQTMVMDPDAHRLSLVVEETNIRVAGNAAKDAALGYVLESGSFTIRLDRLAECHLLLDLPVDALVAEVCGLGRGLQANISLGCPDAVVYPLLSDLEARYFYRLGVPTGHVIHPPYDHGRLEMLPQLLLERLRAKVDNATAYPSTCRPLWLVLDVDHHFDVGPRLEAVARPLVRSEYASGFDRVVVQHLRRAPIVIDG